MKREGEGHRETEREGAMKRERRRRGKRVVSGI